MPRIDIDRHRGGYMVFVVDGSKPKFFVRRHFTRYSLWATLIAQLYRLRYGGRTTFNDYRSVS